MSGTSEKNENENNPVTNCNDVSNDNKVINNEKKCTCQLSCCELTKLYQLSNEKIKAHVEEILKLQEKINTLYVHRNEFEKKTEENIIIQSVNAILLINNIFKNIMSNNKITEITQVYESTLYNACLIALKQINSALRKLHVYTIEPEIGDTYDSTIHNAISTTNDPKLSNQSITYLVESGAYYQKQKDNFTLIKAAIVIINIH